VTANPIERHLTALTKTIPREYGPRLQALTYYIEKGYG
jgi:hypothetical protein